MPSNEEILINTGDWLKITHPSPEQGGDGEVVYVRISATNAGISTNPGNTSSTSYSDTIGLDVFNGLGMKRTLKWHNCYSFGNGVESNRVGDIFNASQIRPGVRVSTVFEEYKEERRKHGLIYSGLYNSTSGVNNLNQFVQAEKITKDINPVYGSIQKLHTRDTDLITLCEDKVLRILANKDAVYNADGNVNLTANENVLGQAIPFVGEYGISKNPESFVSEAYRSYFTDKQRGAVMRLSKDGLTPISMHGMRDWFRDNLSTSKTNLLGENNLSWGFTNWDIPGAANLKIEDGVATLGYFNNDIESDKYGLSAKLRKNDILKVGHRYRFQCDTIYHSGLEREETLTSLGGYLPMRQLYPTLTLAHGEYITGSGEEAWNAVNVRDWRSYLDDYHINVEFVAASTDIEINQLHVNSLSPIGYYTPPDGTMQTVTSWVEEQRAGYPSSHNPYIYGGNYLFGSILTIKNLVLEEIKAEPKIIGSYDDRQEEYNLTINDELIRRWADDEGETRKGITVSFREDVTGWVSFKSFVPEAAISCANDYYTVKDGKLWQHHVAGIDANRFYGERTDSKLSVILNDFPDSMKSFHTLSYEGSQSKIDGIRTVEVTGIEHFYWENPGRYFFFELEEMDYLLPGRPGQVGTLYVKINQYRDNMLIYSGLIRWWDDTSVNSGIASPSGGPTKGHGRRTNTDGYVGNVSKKGDFQVGDIITTEVQEKVVDPFNSMPKDGWFVKSITTNTPNLHRNRQASLPEFIEKEGKWFNYIKGVHSDITETTDFGSFDIQGIGFLKQTITAENAQEWIDSDSRYAAGAYGPAEYGWDWVNNIMEFDNPVNASLQVGDAIYYETPSKGLGSELLENGDFSDGSDGWVGQGARDFTSIPGKVIIGDTSATYSEIRQNDILTIGKEYEVRVEIIDNSQAASWSNISINNYLDGSAIYSASYHYISSEEGAHTYRWKANVNDFKMYVSGQPNYGQIFQIDNVSVREVETAATFGFVRLEAENMVKFGTVIDISSNRKTITVDENEVGGGVNSALVQDPRYGAFILFSKNQAVNTSNLLGYYMDVRLHNNSKRKAEIFSLNSEITESSK